MTKASIPLKKDVLSQQDTEVTSRPAREWHSLEPDTTYQISIPVFEGPIDLLLYLIKKNELDIHEVSLARIANEYLEYVELIKLVNLEMAGEFIVVASTLMKIKSRSLFLTNTDEVEETEEEGTKAALIKYLLECYFCRTDRQQRSFGGLVISQSNSCNTPVPRIESLDGLIDSAVFLEQHFLQMVKIFRSGGGYLDIRKLSFPKSILNLIKLGVSHFQIIPFLVK